MSVEIENLDDRELMLELKFHIKESKEIKKKDVIVKTINTKIMRKIASEAISRGISW